MNKLNVGDYARYNGKIYKITEIGYVDNKPYSFMSNEEGWFLLEDSKSSPNIIDLIEVGDYVNENKIINISNDHCGRKVLVWGFDNGDFQCAFAIYEEDIKSIVTHEQFENNSYKVGE